MSNTATMELPASAHANVLVVETSRGPSLAGTRITVYAIMDCLKDNQSHEMIKEDFLISDEQLNAVMQYIATNLEAVEWDYDAIVRRSEERRFECGAARHEPLQIPDRRMALLGDGQIRLNQFGDSYTSPKVLL